MDDAVFRDIHDLDEPSARPFNAATRCSVLRVASNPQRIKPNAPGQRDQQSNGSAGIVMTPIKRVNAIANMPGIHFYMARGSDAEPDGAKLFTGRGVKHSKMIGRNFVDRVGCEKVQH